MELISSGVAELAQDQRCNDQLWVINLQLVTDRVRKRKKKTLGGCSTIALSGICHGQVGGLHIHDRNDGKHL